jgi:hypothetical protein
MTPYKHQLKGAKESYDILAKYGLVYISWKERCGKTLTAILVVEQSTRSKVLVLTKKKAIGGWLETIKAYNPKDEYTVINYEGIHRGYNTPKGKRKYKLKYNPKDYDIIILDEAHNSLSSFPKTSAIWSSVALLCVGQPIIYLSATPNAQGYHQLFNQLRLSEWSPFTERNPYRWFEKYGISSKVRTSYGLQETYKKCKTSVWDEVKHLFNTLTRKEIGFEHEPNDVIHYVELGVDVKKIYNDCIDNEMLELGELVSPLDSSMKLRTTLHMLESGVAKIEDEYILLDNDEKIRAILDEFGDSEHNVIMYNYIAEQTKLLKYFKKTKILSGISFSEGVDLSMYDTLIILSQNFSTSKHSQRRARQANMKRTEPINVHFYLVKGAISEQVYKTVSLNKTNYIDSMFERETL